MRAMVSTACVNCYFSISVIHTRFESKIQYRRLAKI